MFKSFYNPTEEELKKAWESDNTLFIFDTNILLNIYGYKEQTRNDFFNLMNEISNKVWIPYHVALEYHRRRLDVIKNEKQILKDFRKSIEKIKAYYNEITNSPINKRFPDLQSKTLKLKENIQKLIEAHLAEIDKQDTQQPCVRSNDEILSKIDAIFLGKVGSGPENQEELDKLYTEGEARYSKKIPPGYKDIKKEDSDDFSFNGLLYQRKYGDLIIWKQIIKKAKSDDIKDIIFITDDAKEDWWNIMESQGEKYIGPHNLLREEIIRESNIEIFHMYKANEFLEHAKSMSIGEVEESSINDAKEVAENIIQNNKLDSFDALNKKYEPITIGDIIKVQEHRSALEKMLEHESEFEKMLKHRSALEKTLEHKSELEKMLEHRSALEKALEHKSELEKMLEHESALEKILKHKSEFEKMLEHESALEKVLLKKKPKN